MSYVSADIMAILTAVANGTSTFNENNNNIKEILLHVSYGENT